jgi:flagella basal body P-ring formation protein FlgA
MRNRAIRRQPGMQYEPIAALGAVGVVALLLAVLLFAGPARADVVTLRPEAFVKGPTIVLSDIADIEGGQAAALAGIEVGAAPQPGASRRINLAMLTPRIRAAGVDPSTVELKGAASVSATTLSNEVSKDTLVESLRDYILANMPFKPEDCEIDIPQPYDDIVVPDGTVEIEWRINPQYHYIGSGGFRAEVKVDGKLQRTVMMRANINAYAEVLVAKAEIQRGTLVRPELFEVRKELLTNTNGDRVRDPKTLTGQLAKKSIFPGQPFKSSDFEAPQVIKRNQIINVETRAGALVVQSQAVAMNDARIGDLLLCSNPGSSQNFQGVVRGDGTVVVP